MVTGCNRGIGKAFALALAEAGADIIGASSGLEEGSEVELVIKAFGKKFTPFKVDFSNRDAIYDFINKVKSVAVVDILVNNAGIILRKPAAEHSDEYWDKVLSVNMDAQFILTREFGKIMLERRWGKIVFTCSMLSYQGGINVPGYTASKSAVAGLVRAFANEWASTGVNVNGIAPGYIETDNTQALRDDVERNKSILSRIPANRCGTPEDFTGAIIYLCSDAAAYVNGTVLNVDGGWMAR